MAAFAANRVVRTDTLVLGIGGAVRRIDAVVLHAGYSDQTLRDDIALIRLVPDAATPAGPAVSLPTAQWPRLSGEPLRLTGFGKTGETIDFSRARDDRGGANLFADSLLYGNLRHVPRARCAALGKRLFEKTGRLEDGQMCAESPVKTDACQGDSGGPLVYDDPTRGAVIVGLVSFGKGRSCGVYDLPGVYTDVQHYVRTGWIGRARSKARTGKVIKVQ
jgi:secreted trypsin-like serine protease